MDLEGFAFEGEGPPGPDTSFWLSEDLVFPVTLCEQGLSSLPLGFGAHL